MKVVRSKIRRIDQRDSEVKLWYDCGCIHQMMSRETPRGDYEYRDHQKPRSCPEHDGKEN